MKTRTTITIDKDLLKEIKLLAVKKEKNLSFYVEEGLKFILERESKNSSN